MMLRRVLPLALAALAIPAAPADAIDSPGCAVRSEPIEIGVSEASRTSTDGRLLDLRLRSAASKNTQPVRVLLPAGYDDDPARRWPVLYLYHGAFEDYTYYTSDEFREVIDGAPYIVVMPDDGPNGSYSDWYGTVPGSSGPIPTWETFHTRELVAWVDATFRTQPDAAHRSAAGLSSGGAGAAKYAAANPGLFGAIGSFSGAVNTTHQYPVYPTISEVLWGLTLIPGMGPPAHCTWGDPYTQHRNWLDNDPTYLAENLKGTAIYLASGNGEAGPYDSAPTYDPVEAEVWGMTQEFAKALDAAGLPHTDHFYGGGTHSAPYWRRELKLFLDWLAPRVGATRRPASFNRRSLRDRFSSWGWDFHVVRDEPEFTFLRDVSKRGLAASGSGTLEVTTAPLYRPRSAHTVTSSRGAAQRLRADSAGRLRFNLALGENTRVRIR